jgi:hypothetical protein
MGSGRFDAKDWASYSTAHISGKSTDAIYASKSIKNELNPKGVAMRESCDSVDNPESNAIIVALDVTGSMAGVLQSCAEKLGTLVTEIYERKPVSDPHMMFMGVGDVECDSSPLQVTQFEADMRIAEQLQKIYFEQGGGGNSYESYALAWYFAGLHTRIDCFEKRGKKWYLFTIGDEEPTPIISAHAIHQFIGDSAQKDFTTEELLEMAARQYNVYHLIIEEGSHCSSDRNAVVGKWSKLLGQHAIPVADHTKIAEIIVSILQHDAGVDKAKILKSWDGATALVVSKAIDGLSLVEGAAAGSGPMKL